MQHLNVKEIHQFGGKKLKDKDQKQKTKGKTPTELKECSCVEVEYPNKKEIPVKDKMEQLMVCMHFSDPMMYKVEVASNKITIQSCFTIRPPTNTQIKRFVTQMGKIVDKKSKGEYYKFQSLKSGYFV